MSVPSSLTEKDISSLSPEELESLLASIGISGTLEADDKGQRLLDDDHDRALDPIRYYRANRAQEPFHHSVTPKGSIPKLRVFEAGNKVGKSCAALVEGLSFSRGFRSWLPEDHPQYRIPVRVPNTGRIIAEDFPTGIQQNIVDLLKQWRPVGEMPGAERWFKKNQAGYYSQIFFNNGSIIHLMSYDQDPAKFEGVDWDWCMYNEPPPRDVFIGNERGKIAKGGWSWMAYTPLKEPWIYDEIVLRADEDDETQLFRGIIKDNWKGSDFVSEHTGEIHAGILSLEDIMEYIKRLTPDEREARIFGKWKHLEGLVLKEFDNMMWEGQRIEHIVDDFTPPRDAMWVEGLDPHDKKPTCMLFGFLDREDRLFWAKQLVMEGTTVPEMGDIIHETRAKLRYRKPAFTVMDARAGGWDMRGVRSDAFVESFEKQFRDAGILTIGSDSRPGAKESGLKVVREYLRPEFNVRTKRYEPKMMFFRSLGETIETNRGRFGCIHQLKRWQYDDKGEMMKKFDDFPDIVRYVVSRRPRYRDPSRKDTVTIAYKNPVANPSGY